MFTHLCDGGRSVSVTLFCRVITPVRVIKVIPPSEHSPRSRSRSPLKPTSPNSSPKLPSPQSKSKHPSPPQLYLAIHNSNSSAGSPTRCLSPTKLLSPRSPPPASPVKINSNSHVVLCVSPHHTASPLKSPLRLPVISKVPKSPPPLLPINHVKDSSSASSLHCLEDPLITLGKSSPSENFQQVNGLPESSRKPSASNASVATVHHASEKGSEAKFRTPKTPLAPLSSEIDLDPNDYRYMVEEIKNPDVRLVVKPSQITRGKGVLTPKKLKIFLRNALHRISEKHPFTVKVNNVCLQCTCVIQLLIIILLCTKVLLTCTYTVSEFEQYNGTSMVELMTCRRIHNQTSLCMLLFG